MGAPPAVPQGAGPPVVSVSLSLPPCLVLEQPCFEHPLAIIARFPLRVAPCICQYCVIQAASTTCAQHVLSHCHTHNSYQRSGVVNALNAITFDQITSKFCT
jgi:hypothetical protein